LRVYVWVIKVEIFGEASWCGVVLFLVFGFGE
jgi:hypothetical protein